MTGGGVAGEGVHRREAGIARRDGIAALGLGMIEEGQQVVRPEIGEVEGRRRALQMLLEEAQEQFETVAVRQHCVAAGPAHLRQVLGEEGLQGAAQGVRARFRHGWPPAAGLRWNGHSARNARRPAE